MSDRAREIQGCVHVYGIRWGSDGRNVEGLRDESKIKWLHEGRHRGVRVSVGEYQP